MQQLHGVLSLWPTGRPARTSSTVMLVTYQPVRTGAITELLRDAAAQSIYQARSKTLEQHPGVVSAPEYLCFVAHVLDGAAAYGYRRIAGARYHWSKCARDVFADGCRSFVVSYTVNRIGPHTACRVRVDVPQFGTTPKGDTWTTWKTIANDIPLVPDLEERLPELSAVRALAGK